MVSRIAVPTRVRRYRPDGSWTEAPDRLAGEEPLEIRLDGEALSVTMRTPGDDFDLVLGYLLSEGVIGRAHEVRSMDYRAGVDADGHRNYNVIDVRLSPGHARATVSRRVYTSSACGVCGTASLEGLQRESVHPVGPVVPLITAGQLVRLPELLREGQRVFASTGGVHAAALFSAEGDEPIVLREDVGRHNAVDKVIGWALRRELLPGREWILQVSARASYELVAKAAMAGIPVLSAVGAASSLAVHHARDRGVCVVGFNRGGGCNVYTHPERVRA